MTEEPRLRRIRSFVRREGRMTPGQQRALEVLFERYALAVEGERLDLDAVFGRRAPRHLEIGFGMGDNLLAMAGAHAENDYLGIEVYRPGIGRLLNGAAEAGISNLRVFNGDAVEVLEKRIGDEALDAVYVFFPDPWPKKRHHKRRLISPAFVQLLTRKLKRGGHLYLATDWEDYAGQMLEVLNAAPGLQNQAPDGGFIPRPEFRTPTKFERRGQALGHGVWDLAFVRPVA